MWAQASFRLTQSQAWEPPVDVFEDEHDVVVVVAMPGVAADRTSVLAEYGSVTVRGERALPLPPGTRALVHQLEIPYGYFERRIALPHGRWEAMSHELANGCLVLRLRKESK
jgi:HSP20 family molecular chaperone IbpA